MAFIESAIKGARGLPAYMEKLTNSIRLVTVTEEAANNIESKALAFPGLKEYSIQRIRPSLTNRGEDETEVIVVDKGNSISLATDLPDLVSAIQEIFTQAGLGEAAEHLKQLPATTDRRTVRFSLPRKNRFYLLQHSDFSRTGDRFKGRRRQAAPSAVGARQTEDIVQALESKWANIVKGGAGDEAIHKLSKAVE
ncbi:hypothetical protein CYMTET_11836 [Cymbomonas tetramitiformis]|uniref:Uncharacterized protein n=1 Tax=Cymbomonas tetramitiformis TaxID=36881 RepID=A0AAE0GL90_9CHLO|nr:hypothetical protein CYMTET_11836 [Cymbomonas tetramitiformis]